MSGDGNIDPGLTWYNRSVDLSGFSNVNVSFWLNFESTENEDDFFMMYWNGSEWVEGFHETDTQIGNGNFDGWKLHSFLVPDVSATSSFQLQYRWETSASSEHFSVDDINITGTI